MTTKICNTCGVNKSLDEFYKKSAAKDGKQLQCKECAKKYAAKYYKDNNNAICKRMNIYHIINNEIIRIKKKDYYENNKESISKQNTNWRLKYPEYQKEWQQNNRDKVRFYNYSQKAKRKGFGIPESINLYFEGSHLHHLHIGNDHQTCIYIPAELHKSIWHAYNRPETMVAINLKVMQWYYGLIINWDLII